MRRRAAEAELFLGKDQAPEPQRPAVEKPIGKPVHQSTTALAAIVSAIAGMASTIVAATKEATDALGGITGLILLGIIVVATVWIIRERRHKSADDGI